MLWEGGREGSLRVDEREQSGVFRNAGRRCDSPEEYAYCRIRMMSDMISM